MNKHLIPTVTAVSAVFATLTGCLEHPALRVSNPFRLTGPKPALPALIAALQDHDLCVRMKSANALAAIGKEPRRPCPP